MTQQHDHDHHDCKDHDHDHDHGHDQDDDSKGGKHSRAQKKFKKAMAKLGLKEVVGINRVTLRKSKNLLISIDDPQIMKSPNSETYIIFGKPNINQSSPNDMVPNLTPSGKTQQVVEKVPQTKVQTSLSAQDYNEEGVDPQILKRVMEYTKKSKAVCIKKLRENNFDEVSTILALDEDS